MLTRFFVAGYLAAMAFSIVYATDGWDVRNLILAGLAAGASWGSKPTGTAFIPPLLLVIAIFTS